jgi:hypothetical protein
MLALNRDVYSGLRREFRNAADWILVAGILTTAYGDYHPATYPLSFLSVKFPGLDMMQTLTNKQSTGVQRCTRMTAELMRKRFGEDTANAVVRLSRIYQVKINKRFYLCAIDEETQDWLNQYQIDRRDWLGEG